MSVAGVSLLVLVAIFVVGTVWPVSIGVAGFASTFVVGSLIAGMATDELFALFPVNLFVLLAGITYMFCVAQRNGTMTLITEAAVRLVRGRVAAIPWIFHVFAILFSSIGAGPAAATAVLAPLALGVAREARISALLMGVMVIHGSHAGSMSPISPIGAVVNGSAARASLPDSSGAVFVNSLLFNIALALAAYLLLGGIALLLRGQESVQIDMRPIASPADGDGAPGRGTGTASPGGGSHQATAEVERTVAVEEHPRAAVPVQVRPQHIATLMGIGVLVVLGIGFRFDIGFTAFAIGLLLTLMSPKEDVQAVASMSWSTILMVCGILTYIGLVSEVGGISLISDALLGIGSPVLAILLIAVVGGLTSLFSATGAVIGVLVPMLGTVLGSNPAIPASGAVSTLAISSSVVDSSPFSLQGAVLVANVEEEQRRAFFRQLFAWGASMVVVGSVVPLILFVLLPMWLG